MNKIKYYIEPENPIIEEHEFVNELIAWAERENHEIDIRNSTPTYINLFVDGKKYIAKLEPPKKITGLLPFGNLSTFASLGYKCIFFYEED